MTQLSRNTKVNLLLDSRIVEKTENVRLTLGKVAKHPENPLFGEDKPWEPRFAKIFLSCRSIYRIVILRQRHWTSVSSGLSDILYHFRWLQNPARSEGLVLFRDCFSRDVTLVYQKYYTFWQSDF